MRVKSEAFHVKHDADDTSPGPIGCGACV
ncbi:hypothetical protein PQD74_gp011 [Stenotrophomonas phage Siara]|uniref:Uncharacterized protein n=1 Tax=Stenotrophomonas phage Siara TaxID=2859658 RepID=A0AAE7WM55_9CAUD|nr:hypothetical protein PQD74_gp011 [Stenotrophomonas phage Siara]QYW02014.1 hypothetical protein CPT_Siara_011 [Stenotrophomonas phage Siara]